MTPPPHASPRFVRWGACEHCGAAGSASETDDRFCPTCLPTPEVTRDRELRVARRVDAAISRARRAQRCATDAPIAPDAEHIWLPVAGRRVVHLFADTARTSRCGHAQQDVAVRADLDTPAPENGAACRSCWTAYRRGHGGPRGGPR